MKTYRTLVEKQDNQWLIYVPELRIHTFGNTLAHAEDMVRDAIGSTLGIDQDSFHIDMKEYDSNDSE